MALAIAQAAQLKPELKLSQALHEYETILSDEERFRLHSQGPPDAMAAIKLTTLIDEKCNSDRRQCMGPRLITFLESVQQFNNVVDGFVSSRPEVAALAANNLTTYFDQLSTLLMNIGRQCPRIHELGSLYPSVGLQRALCEYYVSVIRLCKHIKQSLQKSVYLQLSKALLVSFKTEFGPYEAEIAIISEAVREEVQLASMQAQKLENELQARERLKNSNSRNVIVKIKRKLDRTTEESNKRHLAIDHRRYERAKREALDWLSLYDYQSTYRQIRKAACVIAHLIEILTPRNVVAFFFCRFDNHESVQAKTINGSIARQLVMDLPAATLQDFVGKDTNGVVSISVLERTLDPSRQYFIVLDGLDECKEVEIKDVTEFFYGLLLSPVLRVKIFWSSRPNANVWLTEKSLARQRINLESIKYRDMVAHDICKFLRVTLEGYLEGDTPKLEINDPSLALTIRDHLERKAQGMFLWVKYQLQTLCKKKSDTEILDALDHLPRDLPQTYERILSQYNEPDDIEIGQRIFRWTAIAKRPLTVDELQEAIVIQPLQETRDSHSCINNMQKALACCGNLVFVDEEKQTIHFTHSSVRQYLLSDSIEASLKDYSIDVEKTESEAGAICVTYLNFPEFEKQIARPVRRSINPSNITSTVVRNSLSPGTTANKIALRFLREDTKSSKSVQRLFEEASGDTEQHRQQSLLRQFAFKSYAERFWLDHTKEDFDLYPKLLRLWYKLIQEAGWRDTLSGVPWTIDDWNNRTDKVMHWIAANKHCSLAKQMFASEGLHEENIEILIKGAASRGFLRLLTITLDSGRASQPSLDAALLSGAGAGHIAIVETLLQKKANVNAIAKDTCARKLLPALSKDVQPVRVQLLIQERAKINFATSYKCRTAMQAASRHGFLAVVERLLEENADVNATAGYDGRTALQAAARSGHLAVLERLIQAQANVSADAAECNGRTALQAAAEGGHLDVVETLLETGAEVNAPAARFNGVTALEAATKGGHLEIRDRLVSAGAT
ncbi:uncharacterized protein KY384_000400 [Bacidia gigantensis]|uniref:uncharacterized protein n=1 Tax=Bacidia gigantensis TaxID=2732470 RepID=UPI001D048EEF|nr:uncharacterized protein KY384_000400 [Bacidia gigantensis]KAG8525640.1 hypothetical protein KY384_000400 [Bacidia gigantensis]